MEATLEARIAVLEKQMVTLLSRVGMRAPEADWRSTVGMFAGDPVMKTIQQEGQKIRAADLGEEPGDHP